MGIMSNSASICQFRVVGEMPEGKLFDWIGECLDKGAFVDIERTADELSTGWVRTDDYQSSDFSGTLSYRRDNFASFTLRQDKRRIPTPLLKAYQKVQELEFLGANPGFFKVPKQKREEIKEAVRLALFARTLPAPAMYDAVWDTRNNVLTLATVSSKVIDLFETEFKKSFPGLRLLMIHPYARALTIVPEPLLPVLEQSNLATSETVLDLIRANCWIGQDFLLWLLYQTLNGSGSHTINSEGILVNGDSFTAFLNDRLLLQATGDSGVQKVTVAGSQDDFFEVMTALKMGKVINEATIHFEKEENAWKLTLKGEMFHFGSFKCPAVQIEKDSSVDKVVEEEAVFFERMHLLGVGLQMFDSLFGGFLAERLSPEWPARLVEIREWIDSK